MKIHKLTENKIKFILSHEDYKNYNISLIIRNTDTAHDFFKLLLKKAQKKVDFKYSNEKMLIDIYYSQDAYCTIVFTKLNSSLKDITYSDTVVYKFLSLDDFLDFCIKLKSISSIKKFAKYTSFYRYKSNYYFILTDINSKNKYINFFNNIILEFATLCNNSVYLKSTILEHGTVIFQNKTIKNC